MSSHSGYMVVLEGPLKDKDSERVIDAIRLIKGVVRVDPVEHKLSDAAITRMSVKTELAQSLGKWIRQNCFGLEE